MAEVLEKVRKTPTRKQTNVLSDKILTDFMANRGGKSLKDLKGKIAFREDYDYKSMRS